MGEVCFMPLSTFVDPSFWNELNRKKLNEWKLDETPQPVFASYCNFDQPSSASRLSLSFDAFCKEAALSNSTGVSTVSGRVHLLNTLVAFRTLDRKRLITECGLQATCLCQVDQPSSASRLSLSFDAFCKEAALSNSTGVSTVSGRVHLLNTLVAFRTLDRKRLITECGLQDLKHFHYWYWNCLPALLYPRKLKLLSEVRAVDETLEAKLHVFSSMFGGGPFLLLTPEQCAPLSQLFDVDDAHLDAEKVTIVFSDPSTHARVPGWPLRNLLAAVAYHKRKWCSARLIAYRANARLPSICLHLGWIREESDENFSAAEMVGWERTQKGSAEPSFVDMSSTFDPVKLVDEGVRLNLSLIRWRLVPEINLERFTDLRCLILGSGTLGCNVARGLLAWGVRRIVFVDSSHVSLSNPVRQSLFEFEDAVAGGTSKARAAAERLRRIVPSVDSSWVEMQVPMPGHTVTVQEESKVRETVEKLESLIKNSDVVFLVMDSREARWLPTLLCTVHAKLAISVAMGFDSYVVIRHGVMPVGEQTKISAPEEVCSDGLLIPGSQLGCYFCSDVTAPGNSMLDRTLDQQCTVSRAGISMAAAGMAVELLASVLQHPELGQASARIGEVDDAATVLGATPHQIRAFISRFHQMTPTVRRFERCVACGEAVVGAYREQGFAFLLNALNDPKHLEFVSGLEQLQASAEQLRIEFDDDDISLSSE
ncbi:Ubiquitin-like modifier-activating enzyme ATG7 [Toxocara canis]|uniref:Ubiquitin-like modifier-activating enzyme ATG7 n=1 Tax=Toxocara canis TaxID=6265 RepID=A0A0B2VZE0_TOXCA|nr:Ubiquitin-like modifier-activating enzyme ATG7 [Toxocara canis]